MAVVGPTASGKTDLAISLCQKFGGEIISVDSRQAYKEMNIGTGKMVTTGASNTSAPILQCVGAKGDVINTYLYDLALPSERLNAYDYATQAREKINEIWSKNKIPFLVGGTGFYMDVILGQRQLSGVTADQSLRDKLEGLSKEELLEKLRHLDPDKLQTIDVKNKYRLIRAIEIAVSFGHAELGSASITKNETLKRVQGDVLTLSLTAGNGFLYERADRRVDAMIEAGLVDEVKRLVKSYGWEAPGMKTLGYREFRLFFEGAVSLKEAIQKLKFNTHAYIRRQKTYFKKYFADALWFDIREPKFVEEVNSKVELYLA